MSSFVLSRLVGLGLALITIGAIGFHSIPGMIASDAEGNRFVNAIYVSVCCQSSLPQSLSVRAGMIHFSLFVPYLPCLTKI